MKTKRDLIAWGLILIIIGLFLWQLPNIYELTSVKKEKTKVNNKIIEEKIPNLYSCNLIDKTTEENGYITNNTVKFSFDEKGNVKTLNMSIEYNYSNVDLYNNDKARELNLEGLSYNIESNDETKTNKITLNADYSKYKTSETEDGLLKIVNDYPTTYSKLKKYLSNHLYSCR